MINTLMSIHTSTPVGAYRRFLCLYGVVNVKCDLIKNIQVYCFQQQPYFTTRKIADD